MTVRHQNRGHVVPIFTRQSDVRSVVMLFQYLRGIFRRQKAWSCCPNIYAVARRPKAWSCPNIYAAVRRQKAIRAEHRPQPPSAQHLNTVTNINKIWNVEWIPRGVLQFRIHNVENTAIDRDIRGSLLRTMPYYHVQSGGKRGQSGEYERFRMPRSSPRLQNRGGR